MNGTYREIERRIKAFRKRTGLDLGAVWIVPERFAMLPEPVRKAHGPHRMKIAGVPVRVSAVLPPL